MKILSVLAILVAIASSVSIKTKLLNQAKIDVYTDKDCVDLNGNCKRPCHTKWEDNYGVCPDGETYDPTQYSYNYYDLDPAN